MPTPSSQPDDELVALGTRLRDARETIGFTQSEVSGAIGIPRTSVLAIEAGKRNVTTAELKKFARLYRRSIEWLLGEAEPDLSSNVALFRATDALSPRDREQVLRFAEFLASGRPPEDSGAS
ncbi:helix-turn-helix domain-containing protein [Agromyces mariniharenae]|uniref:Helix-turn-helix transcriptional regulator n=1 Tax=Agromyces mariniharenae TaxID=2604423 RepID=A0A5S4V3U0_9MICO|nr:helix-turn-helix transcriptional regulator [Agromyces mariniharenae]